MAPAVPLTAALRSFIEELMSQMRGLRTPEELAPLEAAYANLSGGSPWVHTVATWWVEHVGAIAHGRAGVIFQPLVARYGVDEVLRVAAFYAGPDGPKIRNPQYFADGFAQWKASADQALAPIVAPDGTLNLHGRSVLQERKR
jgi:hypothetical protein